MKCSPHRRWTAVTCFMMASSAVLVAPPAGASAQEPLTDVPALANRPPRRGPPSVRGLKLHEPTPIPGVGQLRRAFSPCLTADLKTIVFANWLGRKTEYDLYLATRSSVDEPFGPAGRIEGTVTPWTDAYPTLSADGLELIYLSADDAHPRTLPKLLRSTRPHSQAPFSQAKELPLAGIGASRRLANPQLIDHLRLKVCVIDSETKRSVRVASRVQADAAFKSTKVLPLENPWPLWWISADGLRAYTGVDEGICISFRDSIDADFSPMEVVVPANVVGKIDGPIWLAPQEDVAFYCSPGIQGRPDAGRHLMMIAF